MPAGRPAARRRCSRGPSGPAPRLSDAQLSQVEQVLLEGATANGLVGELWTLDRVALVIWRLTGVRHHPAHVWALLRYRLGWTVQRPKCCAAERDQVAIDRWIAERWPRIRWAARPPQPRHAGLAEHPAVLAGGGRLPAYAPELNPVEGLWSRLKAVELGNLTSATLGEVIAQAHQGVERVRRTPAPGLLVPAAHRPVGLLTVSQQRPGAWRRPCWRAAPKGEGVADHRRVRRDRGPHPPTIQPPATTLIEAAGAMVLLKHRQPAAATAPPAQRLDSRVV
jgi:hypothetical protein